ncbi:energy-coupling factor transporter transmembrane component T family protein [Isachenkonia alkalipeptolytica]|uniref:Energy-coupling factor transporter transmembrane protein EcfT n=1 Tax=Isachenkonia alkalipeptolytica TaxID=2565777 RepID=A0AA43XLL6_9CLOT|nr:energy-coupling factor transporter transmembrane component T [Isachenkonia alkalipeptolytica]NBG88982.1 energy-coupling factor transporter transmembrane protein EcfT [Isachenkonia alkalipeptolytica]
MLKDITIGQHYPTGSPIHKMDPRIKIIITFLYIISLFVVNNFAGYIFVVAFLLGAIIISKVPVMYIVKGLKPLMILIGITFMINIFMTTGEVVLRLGPFTVTEEGLYQAFFMALRLIFLVMGTSLLTLTTSPIALTDGIEHILNPFKRIGVPAHELAMMMTIALRFIPTLLEETDKIMKAQIARGADFESGNLISRAKGLVPLLVPLFISSFRRADELAMAMEARCYRGGENRTRMKELKTQGSDYFALSIGVLLIALLIGNRIWF